MLTYISNSAHYKEVLSRVLHVKESLWIGTADIKDLYIEDGKIRPSVREKLEVKLRQSGNALKELFGNPIKTRWTNSIICWYDKGSDINDVYVDFR